MGNLWRATSFQIGQSYSGFKMTVESNHLIALVLVSAGFLIGS